VARIAPRPYARADKTHGCWVAVAKEADAQPAGCYATARDAAMELARATGKTFRESG